MKRAEGRRQQGGERGARWECTGDGEAERQGKRDDERGG